MTIDTGTSGIDRSDWGLTLADDALHERNSDPWWTETVWFAWMVPERKMLGYFYPMFRPNLGVVAGGVLLFDDSAELPWELPVFDYGWHRQIPEGMDLRHMHLDNDLTLDTTESGHYDLGYDSRDFTMRLHAESVCRPMLTSATPPFIKGHIDQLCHVTGTMTLHGEDIEVDCIAMRDRSWGPRIDGKQPTVGYDYSATDKDNAFLAVSVSKGGPWDITTGFHIKDGVWSQITGGVRTVERDHDGRPKTITIDATDADGRAVRSVGTAVSHQVFTPYPSMFDYNSLVEWEGDAAGWGEDQDCWHPRRWRQFLAEHRKKS
jgi:hypothetical protein